MLDSLRNRIQGTIHVNGLALKESEPSAHTLNEGFSGPVLCIIFEDAGIRQGPLQINGPLHTRENVPRK
jgi:hypothetical protein